MTRIDDRQLKYWCRCFVCDDMVIPGDSVREYDGELAHRECLYESRNHATD